MDAPCLWGSPGDWRLRCRCRPLRHPGVSLRPKPTRRQGGRDERNFGGGRSLAPSSRSPLLASAPSPNGAAATVVARPYGDYGDPAAAGFGRPLPTIAKTWLGPGTWVVFLECRCYRHSLLHRISDRRGQVLLHAPVSGGSSSTPNVSSESGGLARRRFMEPRRPPIAPASPGPDA